MIKQKNLPRKLFQVLGLLIITCFLTVPLQAQSDAAYEDEYAALLSRMVELGNKKVADEFLEPVEYWQDLWDRVEGSNTWTQMMNNAVLYTAVADPADQSDVTYALLTQSDKVAWLAFPGVSTDKARDRGTNSAFITWPGNGNTDSKKDVHENYYYEWTQLQGQVTQWLTTHRGQFDKLIVTGHSRGAVLAQYFIADYADDIADKIIHLVLFGSPNGGSGDFTVDWANRSNLNRAAFYTTRGDYTNIDPGIIGTLFGDDTSESVDDLITWKESKITISVPGAPIPLNLSDQTYYPRGLSRSTEKYVTDYDYSNKLHRTYLHASDDSGLSKEKYAYDIHGNSYYLAGLQDAVQHALIEPYKPMDITLPKIKFMAPDHPGWCIGTNSGNQDNGTNIRLESCTSSTQHAAWLPYGTAFRLHGYLNKCLDLDGNNTSNGTNIQLWDCHGSDAQKWFYDGLKGVVRSMAHPDKCLNRKNANIELADCDDSVSQQWTVEGAVTSDLKNSTGQIQLAAHPGKCIDNAGGRTTDKNNIQLWDCQDGNENQQWYFNGVEIQLNAHWNKCLDLLDNKTDNGQNIQLYGCSGWDNQKWLYDGLTQQFRSKRNPKKCLDLSKGATDNGANIQIWDCMTDNPNQQWTVVGVEIKNLGSIRVNSQQDKCIDNAVGITDNNNNIQLWDCQEGNANQVWFYDGTYIRLNENRNKCLDLDGSNTTNGRNIQLFDCNETNAQKWIYDAMTNQFRSKVDLNKCFDMTNGAALGFSRGTNIQLWDCVEGHPNQQFILK